MEKDPTALEPDDDIPGEEEVPEDEYLHPEVAQDDDTIDNEEQEDED